MTYGDAKRRDIARSVLPSTRRKAARADLAATRRRNRRKVRAELAELRRSDSANDVVSAWEQGRHDESRYPTAEVAHLMWARRGADKLSTAIRWGRATTADLPREERLDAVRRVLGGTMAGRHALGHLADDEHFRLGLPHEIGWFWRLRIAARRRVDPQAMARSVAVRALEEGRHAELNRWLKTHPGDDGRVRTLAGWHDVDSFAADIASTGGRRWAQRGSSG